MPPTSDSTHRTRSTQAPISLSLPPVNIPLNYPHIRTPSPSSSHRSHQPIMSVPRLPRFFQRVLIVVGLIGAGMVLVSMSTTHGGLEEGVWDATSYSDRRGSSPGGFGSLKRKISDTFGSNRPQQQPINLNDLPIPSQHIPRPNLNRMNTSQPISSHPGRSRTPVHGAPDKYTTSPLPSLDEAFAHLEPKLRDVKAKTQSVPREHQLWNPIFSPYVTPELKERYRHLVEEWDEETGEWKRVERRWLMTCICRQVAGESPSWFLFAGRCLGLKSGSWITACSCYLFGASVVHKLDALLPSTYETAHW